MYLYTVRTSPVLERFNHNLALLHSGSITFIMETKTMQAVVYEGPFNIVVKEKPRPVLLEEMDAILKVHIAG